MTDTEDRLVERAAAAIDSIYFEPGQNTHAQAIRAAQGALEASGLLPLLSAATTFIEECDRMGWGETSETALPGSYDALVKAVREVKG